MGPSAGKPFLLLFTVHNGLGPTICKVSPSRLETCADRSPTRGRFPPAVVTVLFRTACAYGRTYQQHVGAEHVLVTQLKTSVTSGIPPSNEVSAFAQPNRSRANQVEEDD